MRRIRSDDNVGAYSLNLGGRVATSQSKERIETTGFDSNALFPKTVGLDTGT
jgi:hypothetical protein